MKNQAELFNAGLELLFAAKLQQKQLTGWFEYQELRMQEREAMRAAGHDPDDAAGQCVRRNTGRCVFAQLCADQSEF